jgi:hypothetical protein
MEKQISLNVKGISYKIEFPNVGNFQNIETMKQVVSKGMYSSLLTTGTVSAMEVLDMVDMEAYFTVLCPKLIKDLNCETFGDLDIADYKEIKTIYQKQFVPWWNLILNLLSPTKEEE